MDGERQAVSTRIVSAITWLLIKMVLTAAALFVLLRVVSPSLMTLHNNLSFWIGAACWPLALVLAIWAVVWISRDVGLIRGLLDDQKRLPRVL
jgi:hypothetical protein